MDTLNTDILNIIIPLSNNPHCLLVCKLWHKLTLQNSYVCKTCNKIVKVYDKEIWAYDKEDEYCHEYKGKLKDYRTFKKMVVYDVEYFKLLENPPKKICEILVENNIDTIKYVRDEFKTKKICLMLATHLSNNYYSKFIPPNMLTEELCYEMIKVDGFNFEIIPEHLCTDELCWKAVQLKRNSAFRFLKNKTVENCTEAVKLHESNIKHVPDELKTLEMCFIAIRYSTQFISYIPHHLQTDELCVYIIDNSLAYINEIVNKSDVVQMAIIDKIRDTQHYSSMRYLESIPEDLCKEAIDEDYENIEFINDPSEEVCIYAIQQNYKALKYIKNKSEALCIKAMEINPKSTKYINIHDKCVEKVKPISYKTPTLNDYIDAFNKSPIRLCQYK
jgi:hypothetical protein